jgi:hypothetical protein
MLVMRAGDRIAMPTKQTLNRAAKDKKEGKAASTQAGEFVREQMDRMHEGKGNSKNPKQAIAIGLSEARQAGVAIPDNPKKPASAKKKPAKKAS